MSIKSKIPAKLEDESRHWSRPFSTEFKFDELLIYTQVHLEMRNCAVCGTTLLSKKGSSIASVPLFTETTNKEFKSAFEGKPVILVNMLRSIGIAVPSLFSSQSLCLKCARKVVQCCKVFSELKSVFAYQDPSCSETKQVRERSSPSGLTPKSK